MNLITFGYVAACMQHTGVMASKSIVLLLLFQEIMSRTRFSNAAGKLSETSRSAYFASRENTRLNGHAVKQFSSPSLMACSRSCLSKTWCTSTNFKLSSSKDGKGICELNKHENIFVNEDGKLHDELGVTFSIFLKGCLLTGCFNGETCLFDKRNETFSCFKLPIQTGHNSQVETACVSKPLGMEDGSIADNKITASSTHMRSRAAWGRLHCSDGSWTPNTDSFGEWLQVDFAPEVKLITHIAIQGNGKSWWWVASYYVMYGTGGVVLQDYKENNQQVIFSGNTNKDDIAKNKINNPFKAETVRIIPKSYSGRMALRIELFGCDV